MLKSKLKILLGLVKRDLLYIASILINRQIYIKNLI